jgi:hypothetical protein
MFSLDVAIRIQEVRCETNTSGFFGQFTKGR